MTGDITYNLRRLESPITRELEELHLIARDLKDCISCFQAWASLSKDENSEEETIVTNSLFRNGLITFFACFDEVSPFNLDAEAVFKSLNGGDQYFRWLKDMRDTWVAHRSGPMRQAVVGFFIDPSTGDIKGHGNLCHFEYLSDNNVSEDLIRFTSIALEFVNNRIETLTAELNGLCNALYPNQRKSLPTCGLRIPGHEQRRMGRRKFRNISDPRLDKKSPD